MRYWTDAEHQHQHPKSVCQENGREEKTRLQLESSAKSRSLRLRQLDCEPKPQLKLWIHPKSRLSRFLYQQVHCSKMETRNRKTQMKRNNPYLFSAISNFATGATNHKTSSQTPILNSPSIWTSTRLSRWSAVLTCWFWEVPSTSMVPILGQSIVMAKKTKLIECVYQPRTLCPKSAD